MFVEPLILLFVNTSFDVSVTTVLSNAIVIVLPLIDVSTPDPPDNLIVCPKGMETVVEASSVNFIVELDKDEFEIFDKALNDALIVLFCNDCVPVSVTTVLSIFKVIVFPDIEELNPVPPKIFKVCPKFTTLREEVSSANFITGWENERVVPFPSAVYNSLKLSLIIVPPARKFEPVPSFAILPILIVCLDIY